MQLILEKLKKMEPVVTIQFEGEVFTVAKAAVTVGGNIFWAEGLARRSHVDEPNLLRAHEIASGRALKALAKKVICRKPVHHKFMG